MYKRILLSLAVIWGLSQALAVTITSNYVASHVSYFDGQFHNVTTDTFTGTSIPTLPPKTLTAKSTWRDVVSETTVDYTVSGDQVTFANTFNHEKITFWNDTSGSTGDMEFMVDSDACYDLSGLYEFNSDRTEERISLEAYLYDITADSFLVDSMQESSSMTPLKLSFSGTLLASHSYSFDFYALTDEPGTDVDGDNHVSSVGHVTLKIGCGTPEEDNGTVPDSGTAAALLGLSLLGLAAARRRMAG